MACTMAALNPEVDEKLLEELINHFDIERPHLDKLEEAERFESFQNALFDVVDPDVIQSRNFAKIVQEAKKSYEKRGFYEDSVEAYIAWMDGMRGCLEACRDLMADWRTGSLKLEPLPIQCATEGPKETVGTGEAQGTKEPDEAVNNDVEMEEVDRPIAALPVMEVNEIDLAEKERQLTHLFTLRGRLELTEVNFTLENHGEYARLENIDNSIGRLMDDIAAIRGDNFDDDDEPRYKCPAFIPEAVRRKLEEMINDQDETPNFADVLAFTKQHHGIPKGKRASAEMTGLAQEYFVAMGVSVKMWRKRILMTRLLDTAQVDLQTDGHFDEDYDPADYDKDLRAKLAANDVKATHNLQKALARFAIAASVTRTNSFFEKRLVNFHESLKLTKIVEVMYYKGELGFKVNADGCHQPFFMPFEVANDHYHEEMMAYFEEELGKDCEEIPPEECTFDLSKLKPKK